MTYVRLALKQAVKLGALPNNSIIEIEYRNERYKAIGW